ncbi:uncharacterized protein LOC114915337 [Cajanus cajan]|uniref:uncharacterized protein LOC114915337 n=1 Tax=Cajanus cajan TaxID=3821 RepID=UPI0010FB236D|nr:uncharacterized protein LOC114915337 [Cajanus cajan]
MATDQVNIQAVGDNEWSDIQATEAKIANVREVALETDGNNLDIPMHDVILEAAVVRAEEKVRVAEANAEARIKEAVQRESAATKEKEELLAYVNVLKAQLQRQHIDTTQVFEKTESCSDTKHVDPTEENVDKACLSVSRAIPVAF